MNRPAAPSEPIAAPKPPPPLPPQAALMNTDDAANDPLVKTVLEIFEGEVKRVHPKNT